MRISYPFPTSVDDSVLKGLNIGFSGVLLDSGLLPPVDLDLTLKRMF